MLAVYQKGVILIPARTNSFKYIGHKSTDKNCIDPVALLRSAKIITGLYGWEQITTVYYALTEKIGAGNTFLTQPPILIQYPQLLLNCMKTPNTICGLAPLSTYGKAE
jgi:hypothetical protein